MKVDGVELKPGDRILIRGNSLAEWQAQPWYLRAWLRLWGYKPPNPNGIYIMQAGHHDDHKS